MNDIKVSKPQEEILKSLSDRILFLAGQGSGKSYCAGLLSADFVNNYPHVRGFIGANTYQQLSKSTLDRVFMVWLTTFNWVNGKDYVVDKIPPESFKKYGAKLKSYENTISFNNGALIFTSSLDNYLAIDGTEFAWGILDETKDTKEEAVKEVITGRLRQSGLWIEDGKIETEPSKVTKNSIGWNPLYVLTSPAKVDWINEWFGLSDKYEEISKRIYSKTDYYTHSIDGKFVVISSAYHNEENLSKGFLEQRIKDLAGSPNLIDMLIYGSPIAKGGGEFFSQFERLRHVKKVPYLENVNIHISLDFNVVPYITMTCWQIVKDGEKFQVRCFDEFCLGSPKNNTEDLCIEFKRKYLDNKKVSGLFYYGDATGKNSSTLSREHNYDILERVLKKWLNDNSDRVMNRNPSVVATRDFVNKILVGGLPIELMIDNNCKHLIADFEFLKEGPDGGKLKSKTTDKVTGQSFEKYGHTGDSAIYILCSAFNSYFEKNA